VELEMTENHVPEIGIDEYVPQLKGTAGGKRIPLSGTIELTHRCNSRCVHCYANKPTGDPSEKERELTYDEICGLLDQLAHLGCLWILFTGGEPLIREDFADIYQYAKQKGFLINLFTNGTRITAAMADLLAEFPPRTIEISLYGATQETYEKMTRCRGSFEACLHGIRLLWERNLPLKLKTVITTVNKHEFHQIAEFVDALGLEFRFDAMINARIDHQADVTRFRLSPSEVLELDLADPRRGSEYVSLYNKMAGVERSSDTLFQCGAGLNSFHVDPHGRLSLCTLMREPSYDLRHGSFQEGWNHFIPSIRQQEIKTKTRCTNCHLISVCDQCPGWAQLENGDPERPVEYLCRVTQLRAKCYGIPLAASPETDSI
jgi:radical SAM protein with 4Fe4S-binding SPASM domain